MNETLNLGLIPEEEEQSSISPKLDVSPDIEKSKNLLEPGNPDDTTESQEPETLKAPPVSNTTPQANESKEEPKPKLINSVTKTNENYRVFARKYRPKTFDDLYGQDAMVQTLTNAFELGRIAQAWMLTGVRGVGKTTTARILARALNLEIPGEIEKPTIKLDKMGVHCEAIMEGRHVDVIEMDAASHTGINDIREITDSARYQPASARYKVFLIDEVHMLSNAAFNGLLKTLEEPPDHVKFIFATTEIRKVPITILSRCQRFDLRRIDAEEIIKLLRRISDAESIEISDEALVLIARAGEGSARDSLSLLDQAVAHGTGKIDADIVRTMMGLADRARIIDLIEFVIKGDIANALTEFQSQYNSGADPAIILTDLADFIHLITRMKVIPNSNENIAITESERKRGATLSEQLSIRILSRVWQILLKGIPEVQQAPKPLAAAEMVLVRLCYSADLPSPEDAFKLFQQEKLPDVSNVPIDSVSQENTDSSNSKSDSGSNSEKEAQEELTTSNSKTESPESTASPIGNSEENSKNLDKEKSLENNVTAVENNSEKIKNQTESSSGIISDTSIPSEQSQTGSTQFGETNTKPEVKTHEPEEVEQTYNKLSIQSMEQIAEICSDKKDIILQNVVETKIRPVLIEAGKIEIEHQDSLPAGITRELSQKLSDWTGEHWEVVATEKSGSPTLRELKETLKQEAIDNATKDSVVAEILDAFDGAKTTEVRKTNATISDLATASG